MIYHQDPDTTIYCGNARDVLASLPSESVQVCVTSPPYYGLRNYGTGRWTGGLDPECNHEAARIKTRFDYDLSEKQAGNAGSHVAKYHPLCPRCGAVYEDEQLGSETSPEKFVSRLVWLFREVRRVLKDDGVVWLNMGDTYQDKQLLMVPAMTAIMLRNDGWWLRRDQIWAKRNTMPENVNDRPITAHEYVYLLAKNESYYFDNEAIREPAEWDRWGAQTTPKYDGFDGKGAIIKERSKSEFEGLDSRNPRSVWFLASEGSAHAVCPKCKAYWSNEGPREHCGHRVTSHYAAFPRELARRCIASGSRIGDTVLDPFMGSGTTAVVARELGRRSIGIDLNEDFCEIQKRRLDQQSLFSTEVIV